MSIFSGAWPDCSDTLDKPDLGTGWELAGLVAGMPWLRCAGAWAEVGCWLGWA